MHTDLPVKVVQAEHPKQYEHAYTGNIMGGE